MSAKKFRLDKVGERVLDGYPWDIVECTECGEEVERRNIEDEGRHWEEDHREDVCPSCGAEMSFNDDTGGVSKPVISSSF